MNYKKVNIDCFCREATSELVSYYRIVCNFHAEDEVIILLDYYCSGIEVYILKNFRWRVKINYFLFF